LPTLYAKLVARIRKNSRLHNPVSFFKTLFISKKTAFRDYQEHLLPLNKKFPSKKPQTENLTQILQINTNSGKGGAAVVANRLHNALRGKYRSYILAANKDAVDDNVFCLKEAKGANPNILNKMNGIYLDFYHSASLHIKDMEIFKNADIVHLHNLHGGYFSIFALPELSSLKPTVWTLHDMQAITGHCAHSFECNKWQSDCKTCPHLDTYPAISSDTADFLLENKKRIYENSHLTVVCPSVWLKHKVENSILSNQKIELIYNGVDENTFIDENKRIARKKLNLPLDKRILMFSAHGGKENVWKGGTYLEKIINNLLSFPNLLFLNIGGQTNEKDKNWIDIPFIQDEKLLSLYYAASDLFIYPSLADNLPLVVLESLSCGTPVIAFNTGGIPEEITHLENGYIARYKDVDDLNKGIHLFLNNDKLYKKASTTARKTVENKFTLGQMVTNYIKLYKRTIHERCC
jgi:glycosyltransferase involved in cell wall biosynthesis